MPYWLKVNSLAINYKAVFNGNFSKLMVGQICKVNEAQQTKQVKCLKLSLDPKLLKYYNYKKYFWAHDEENLGQTGDIVVIQKLKKPQSHITTHKLTDVIFKNGAVVDPMTGKLCYGLEYADEAKNPNLEKHLKSSQDESSL